MELERKVRYIKYSEIDNDPTIPNSMKLSLRKKFSCKKEDQSHLLNFEKIKEGDNREWGFLLELYGKRFRGYCWKMTSTERFIDDIVANAITDAYVSRKILQSSDHLVGHIFQFIRYESLKWMVNGPGRFVLDADDIIKLDWIMDETEEIDTIFEREQWKDKMLSLLARESARLPTRWRKYVTMHLTYMTRKSYRKKVKEIDPGEYIRKNVTSMLKKMIAFKFDNQDNRPFDQFEAIRNILKALPDYIRDFLRKARDANSLQEICNSIGIKKQTGIGYTTSVLSKMREVYYDPSFDLHDGNGAIRFMNLDDQPVREVIHDELFNCPDEIEVRKARKDGFTHDETMQIILLRDEQKMNWREIERVMHSHVRLLKQAYEQHTDKSGSERLNSVKGEGVHTAKISAREALEIKQRVEAGEALSDIHAEYGINYKVAWEIIAGKTWKSITGGKANKPKSKREEAIELFNQGKTCKEISQLIKRSMSEVSRYVSHLNKEREKKTKLTYVHLPTIIEMRSKDMTFRQIGETLGIKEGTAKRIWYRYGQSMVV